MRFIVKADNARHNSLSLKQWFALVVVLPFTAQDVPEAMSNHGYPTQSVIYSIKYLVEAAALALALAEPL